MFTCRHNVMTGCWRTLAGRGISTNAQRAIVEGTEFTSNKDAYAQNSAILWRSELDHDTARAFSGSVLCSGLPSDTTARAVVFQNYEAALKDECTLNDHQVGLTGVTNQATFKGGFILPDEITSSEIVMSCEKGPKPFNSIQKAFKTDKHLAKSRATSGPPDILVTVQPWHGWVEVAQESWVHPSMLVFAAAGCALHPYTCSYSIRFKAPPTLVQLRSPISSRWFWFGFCIIRPFFLDYECHGGMASQ